MPRYIEANLRKKRLPSLLAVAGLLIWGASGCSNREVDTAKLQGAFQSAEPAIRTEMEQGITDVKAGNYSGALKVMRHIAFAGKLTEEQRLILQDSIKKVSAKVK